MIILSEINWKKLLLLTIVFIMIVIILRFFIFTLTPFFFGLIIATIIDKPVELISKKIPRSLAVLIMVVLVLSVVLLLTSFIITNSVYELIYLSRYLPQYREQIMDYVDEALLKQQELFARMPDVISNVLQRNLDALYRRGEDVLSNIIEKTVNITFNIPGLIILLLFTIISAFFLSKDKEKIVGYLKKKTRFSDNKQSNIVNDIFSYIRVQLLIMSNTTVLTAMVFYFLNYPYAILLALLSGVLDLIPVVGPGAVLWPMIIYNVIFNPKNAVIIFILYLIIIGARPTLESRILGRNIGVSPIILLLGVYLGLITFGFQGVILAPISIIIFKSILNTGIDF
ncbi:sporulation integral membrane protein YtvI [Iocasia frigidifontis]|uniref:Sporulation integral membrane protein YtvI n=1 Tax=Iocasia fonsfrigidae TaxID=2682810 RepID=A0A8A7K4S1_9FIRM|nr:sporulation integral membrane protein YtvI [Iocasia fonsfrigidae]QTL96676.1 sporulation integral membrane protein YtvI [Iocasia fonsfrigidae]